MRDREGGGVWRVWLELGWFVFWTLVLCVYSEFYKEILYIY